MMDGVAPDSCVYASGLLAREGIWCGGGGGLVVHN
jgi:hypothetical protein